MIAHTLKHLTIDYSALSLYRTCPRKFYYRYILGYDTSTPHDALSFGGAMHAALDAWHSGQSVEESIKIFRDFAAKTPLDQIAPDERRSIDHGETLFRTYTEVYEGNPNYSFTPTHTEQRLTHPINDWITYCGRVDMIAKNQKGESILVEHKTTYRIDKVFYGRLKPNAQITGYMWLARNALGIPINEAVVNTLQTVTTKLKKAPGECFARITTYRTEAEIVEWEQEVAMTCEDIRRDFERGYWTKSDPDACTIWNGLCQFQDVCNVTKELRRNLLEGSYVIRPWDNCKITATPTTATPPTKGETHHAKAS